MYFLLIKFTGYCIFFLSIVIKKYNKVLSMANKFNFTQYNKNTKNVSRALRKNMTVQEKHLWYDFLKDYHIKFYRQRPVNDFIIDFYSSKAKLAIEIDGSQHYEDKNKLKDENRTKTLNDYGIDVIRFSNYDINTNFEGVCMEIDRVVCKKLGIKSKLF